jgi:hypothetical protein
VQSHTRNIEASVEVFSFPSIIALGFQEDQSERRAIQRCKIKKKTIPSDYISILLEKLTFLQAFELHDTNPYHD